jgi:hypothetical protein
MVIGEEVDQAGIPGLGDVGNRSRSDLAAEQKSSAFVGEDEGFHRVDAALAGNEAVASAAAC